MFSMVLGGDCIDDAQALRAGRTGGLLGWMAAPSTLGTFLRAFTFGHVRQLERVLAKASRGRGKLARAQARAPGDRRRQLHRGGLWQGQAGRVFGYTRVRGLHPILAGRADTGEVLQVRLRKGSANTQRGILRFTDELIARIARAGATGEKLLRADKGFWN